MWNEKVRNYNPGAVTRFRKLRTLSRFMILCAYLLTGLVLGGAGLLLLAYQEGLLTFSQLVASFLGTMWLAVLTFAFSKFLGELSWLLADLGDHQLDVRNLLLDLREDLDRLNASGK